MKEHNFRKWNQYWIILHYFSLVAFMVFFYIGKYLYWPECVIIFEIGFLFILVISFFRAFIRTKFWKMVHTASKNLDEREMFAVLESLRFSYSIFTITTLIIIFIFALIGYHRIDILLAGALLLLAHTLPAAILGWKEKYSLSEEN